ncbi:peptidylprolyl isomerase [Intestinimonas butyriciproducens]|nr:peptidylprolyl isomerase [Intestinimonas butyriciproducens]
MKKSQWQKALLALCTAGMILAAGCSQEKQENEEKNKGEDSVNKATITMENGEKIHIQLDEDQAPITVENFVELVQDGFYDGLTFHRIEPGFVIQGGDPLGNGTGGPGHTIKGEFKANGVNNTISHERGVISMARAQDYDSAGSQFFITLDDATFLDGQYAAFGTVDEESMEVVDAIVEQYLTDGKAPVMESIVMED